MRSIFTVLTLVFSLWPHYLVAQEGGLGPHGGDLMSQGGCHYEIVLDAPKGRVHVYASRLPSSSAVPVTLVLEKNNEVLDHVSLQLMDSQKGTYRYEGALSLDQGSSVGVQFRIEFGPKAEKP